MFIHRVLPNFSEKKHRVNRFGILLLLVHFVYMESFEPGSTVVVESLVSRSDLNGRRGIVHNFVCGSGRYGVQVDGEQASID